MGYVHYLCSIVTIFSTTVLVGMSMQGVPHVQSRYSHSPLLRAIGRNSLSHVPAFSPSLNQSILLAVAAAARTNSVPSSLSAPSNSVSKSACPYPVQNREMSERSLDFTKMFVGVNNCRLNYRKPWVGGQRVNGCRRWKGRIIRWKLWSIVLG
jgi:hypothetical protein